MRLGGKVFDKYESPDEWVAAMKKLGYRAAECPVTDPDADEQTIAAYARAAEENDIVIAEVGAWGNPLAPDDGWRAKCVEKAKKMLALADAIGAKCCVNVAGSRGAMNGFDCETFGAIVESVRDIIDAVKPTRTVYTLETKPTIFPSSAGEYLDLIEAIDRKGFGVHLDPINMINSVPRFYNNARFVTETIRILGPHIVSCHMKDLKIKASSREIVHLDECQPGEGQLALNIYLRELGRLDVDLPVMLEHLDEPEQWDAAAAHLRDLATKEGVTL